MISQKDIKSMIQALTLTIAIHEREEAFFLRSAEASTSEEAKKLFLEIAKDMSIHVANLENKKAKLEERLFALNKTGYEPPTG